MFSKSGFQITIIILTILWAFIFNGLPVESQDVVTSFDLSSGSGAVVLRNVRVKKKTFVATRNKTKARRTVKQKKRTRQTVVRQSKIVARRSRTRRTVKKITPQEFKKVEVQIASKNPVEAAKIFAGAGEYYVENNDLQKAAEFLEESVRLDPKNNDAKLALSEAYTGLGDAAIEADDFPKAKKYYEFALKYDTKNASAYAGLGQVYEEDNDDPNAKTNYEKALLNDENFKQVYAPLGILYYQEGNYQKSEEFIKKALEDEADNPETVYFYGLLRYLNADYENALIALQKSINLDNENAEAYYYLGATYDRVNKLKEAIAAYETAIRLEPDYVNAWFDLGVAYYNSERYEDAIKAYDKAIRLNSNQTEELRALYTESYENRGDAYRKEADLVKTLGEAKSEIDKATSDYNIAYQQKKSDAEFLSKYALTLSRQASIYDRLGFKTSSWDASVKFMEEAVAIKSDAVNYTNLGFVNYRAGHTLMETRLPANVAKAQPYLQKAIKYSQKAIDMKSDFAKAPLLNLGAAYIDLNQIDKAIATLEKIPVDKEFNVVNYLLGISYERIKKYDDSAKYLNRAMLNDPDNFQYLDFLANVQVFRKDKNEIKKIIEKLKKLGTERAIAKAELLKKSIK